MSMTESGAIRGVYTFRDVRTTTAEYRMKFFGKIADGMLSWGDPVGDIGFRFTLLLDGKLHGERYVHGGQRGDVTMTKM